MVGDGSDGTCDSMSDDLAMKSSIYVSFVAQNNVDDTRRDYSHLLGQQPLEQTRLDPLPELGRDSLP